MDWVPIPNDKWQPTRDERKFFKSVYIDESSQNLRYFVQGALVIPLTYAGVLEADISAVRSKSKIPTHQDDGTPRVMKWEKVGHYSLDAYKAVVDAVVNFRQTHFNSSLDEMGIHCLAVDTEIRSLRVTGGGSRETGVEIEQYFLCTAMVAKRYRESLFLIFPDRRFASRRLWDTKQIMNFGAFKFKDIRHFPFRRAAFADPEYCQALQAVDIFIGALAYRLNRHYEALDANPAKVELCDYIWKVCKAEDPFNTTSKWRRYIFDWMIRPKPSNAPGTGGPRYSYDD
jgi:hypothetical protein